MKKNVAIFLAIFGCAVAFSASYTNNTYQKLASEYMKKAENAFDAGEYDLAVEYSQKAEENAALSEAFIKMMLAKKEAEDAMKIASEKIDWAKNIFADKNFPMAFSAAQESFASAQNAYNSEDYNTAKNYAKKVLEDLAEVREILPLPQYYVVQPWAKTKDCYWNISGRPYIYNNPFLWENLYQANKEKMPHPENPNLILPGMKMKIPSISGEFRDGIYSPENDYTPYSQNPND